eukprot:TRINITY_DN3666_c0_g1_i3.p3 TRINITY_DN3666_c0_g1~~TRINITY_DN3666_c0_g1_i3.p3  ORF type:complete len:101 (-),score=23.53 TRINITY_DN3666_c0_g1_i3:358-660(-)
MHKIHQQQAAIDKHNEDLIKRSKVSTTHQGPFFLHSTIDTPLWLQELAKDEKYKEAHGRKCPKCGRIILKMGGCDSMVCGRDSHGGNVQVFPPPSSSPVW